MYIIYIRESKGKKKRERMKKMKKVEGNIKE